MSDFRILSSSRDHYVAFWYKSYQNFPISLKFDNLHTDYPHRFCGLAILQYIFEWLPPWGHGATFSTHVADERITLPKVSVVFYYSWLKTAPSSILIFLRVGSLKGGGVTAFGLFCPRLTDKHHGEHRFGYIARRSAMSHRHCGSTTDTGAACTLVWESSATKQGQPMRD